MTTGSSDDLGECTGGRACRMLLYRTFSRRVARFLEMRQEPDHSLVIDSTCAILLRATFV